MSQDYSFFQKLQRDFFENLRYHYKYENYFFTRGPVSQMFVHTGIA